ncbi:enoyl-CoA hydratase/isomerase family protein [Paracoccus sp. Z330]|uniref:Enoyl-CoA hydratase/isomerase family protein n=1 Tax=Paracoccus onchidii TaxID=3017813 RepID=A0ABT4ZIT3_9RHOB|nr:enoyl-CoA hydratase/isomerase family protein [Paracoccus onchidii]MDB6179275.1 enoyl-CoA hydratase/isomerase family protein [Paracoccus onchidii]
MSSDGNIYLERNGAIGEIVLNRPQKHNALTPRMYRDIGQACADLDADDNLRVGIIRGAGDRAFCAGSDIKALEGYEDFWAWRNRYDYIPPILAVRKPLIAATKGWALGGGMEIALACDLRVAARSTIFSAPEVALGWNGAGGAAQHLVRLCGYGRAMQVLLTAQRFDAETAQGWGMIEMLVDVGAETDAARELATSIAAHSSVATQAVKAAVRNAGDTTVSQGLRYDNELMSLCFAKVERDKVKSG